MREGVVRGTDLLKLVLSVVMWVAVVASMLFLVCRVADQRGVILVDVGVGLSGTVLRNEGRLVRSFWHSWVVVGRLNWVRLLGSLSGVLGGLFLLLKVRQVGWHRVLFDHLGVLGGLVIDSGSRGVVRCCWNASSVGRGCSGVLLCLLVILLLEVAEVGYVVHDGGVVGGVVNEWVVDDGGSVYDRGVMDNGGSVDGGGVVDDGLMNNNVMVRLLRVLNLMVHGVSPGRTIVVVHLKDEAAILNIHLAGHEEGRVVLESPVVAGVPFL